MRRLRHPGSIGAGLVLILLLAVAYLQWPQWPEHLTAPVWSKALFDRKHQLLEVRIAADQQWRLPYTAAQLPAPYLQALLQFEDQHFFRHPGFDPLALLSAAWSNAKAGRFKRGASTLTMQVARLLSGPQPRTLSQKARELLLALQLEWHFSKSQILELYANHAPYGGNIVGLTAASWWYFGREPAALSWSEAALLAVLPHSPGLMYPGRRSVQLQQKRDRLLRQLASKGLLDATDLQLALAEPLPLKPQGWPSQAPHLLNSLVQQAPAQAIFVSTLDAQYQQQLHQVLSRHARTLARSGVQNSALVLLDVQSLQLLAYHGNVSSQGTDLAGLRKAAPAVDIARSRRSSGSILKPFLYALMLDEGFFTPASLLPDVPSQFGGYSPQNFDRQYRGAVRADQALALSLNVPAVRLLHQYGVARLLQQLPKFGLHTMDRTAENYGLSLILGGAEASLLELSSSYARLSHLAAVQNPTQTEPGTLQLPMLQQLLTEPPRTEPLPISQGSAYLTLQALLTLERPETESNWREFANQQAISWKTGTSFGLRDGWAIGSNGRFLVGVWTGNADGSPAAILAGGRSSGPILFDAFRVLPKAAAPAKPHAALQSLEVCASDGFLPRLQCTTQWVDMPVAAKLQPGPSYQKQFWLDDSGRFQLPAGCRPELPRQAQTRLWLPLNMAYFYQPQHPDYPSAAPFWPGCEQAQPDSLTILYPAAERQLQLPLQFNGELGEVVVRALHQDSAQTLYWHLNDRYLGSTRPPHQRAIQATAGQHQLVITASDGSRLSRLLEFTGPPTQAR